MTKFHALPTFSEPLFLAPPTPPEEHDHWSSDHNTLTAIEPLLREEQDVVAVIGVGYVGLHLVESFASSCQVIAYDVSQGRIHCLQDIVSRYPSVTLTVDPTKLRVATHFLISVPTNVLPDGSVDTRNLVSAIKIVQANARRGSTVVIESSVSVGMTRALLGTISRDRGIKAGMSPEVRTN
jgi:UDP-N-acetyl-D-mannosaminuronate dehydrogenase